MVMGQYSCWGRLQQMSMTLAVDSTVEGYEPMVYMAVFASWNTILILSHGQGLAENVSCSCGAKR
jgi:hypothetical protein